MDTQTRLGRTHAPPQSPLSLVTSDCKTSHSHAYARSAHHRAEEGNTTCQPTTSTTSAAFQRAVAEDYAVQVDTYLILLIAVIVVNMTNM